jgi:hypothetical protein
MAGNASINGKIRTQHCELKPNAKTPRAQSQRRRAPDFSS